MSLGMFRDTVLVSWFGGVLGFQIDADSRAPPSQLKKRVLERDC